MAPTDLAGLDYDFHRFIQMTSAGQRRVQARYVPLFAGCRQVVDLGCGEGDFVAMLREQGIDAFGVDSDPKVCAAVRSRGLPIVEQNVLEYLRTVPAASVDGVFCAHLVEHLPYPAVVELTAHAYRILRPGGRVVLATPDARSLFSHLEMYHLHFGHVSFYHPRLLCFMLEHAGFGPGEIGVNPETASFLLPEAQRLAATLPRMVAGGWVPYRREIPPQGSGLLARLSYRLKQALARWLVLPFTDSLAIAVQERLALLDHDVRGVGTALASINGPFECYATAVKPETQP